MSFVDYAKGWVEQLTNVLNQCSSDERLQIIKVLQLIEFKKLKRNQYKDHNLGEREFKGWRDVHPLHESNLKKDLIIIYRYESRWVTFRFIGKHKDFYQ